MDKKHAKKIKRDKKKKKEKKLAADQQQLLPPANAKVLAAQVEGHHRADGQRANRVERCGCGARTRLGDALDEKREAHSLVAAESNPREASSGDKGAIIVRARRCDEAEDTQDH